MIQPSLMNGCWIKTMKCPNFVEDVIKRGFVQLKGFKMNLEDRAFNTSFTESGIGGFS